MEQLGKVLKKYKDPPKREDIEGVAYEIPDEVIGKMYATVYHGLTNQHNLSSMESLLVATIYSLSKTTGYSDISQASLTKLLNSNITTINQTLQEMEEKALINRAEQTGKGGLIRWKLSDSLLGDLQYIKDKIGSGRRR